MRLLLGLGAVAVVVGLVFAGFALRDRSPSETAAPSSSPSAAESAAPSPTPSEPEVAQPSPFKVRIGAVAGQPLDSSNMYGRRPDVRPRNIRASVRRAVRSLERYLNTQFVGPRTRQSERAIRALLTIEAQKVLTPRDRRALGMGKPAIAGGRTIAANANAVVLYEGSRAYAVTLRYTARMNAILDNGEIQRLAQSGSMVLRPTDAGPWRADMVDVSLALRPAPRPKPKPTAPGSEPAAVGSEGGTS